MADDKPKSGPAKATSKAPLIIFGCMAIMSIVSVSIVFATHSQRTEPYLDSKIRKVRRVKRAPAQRPAAPAPDSRDASTK